MDLDSCLNALRDYSLFIPRTRLDWLRAHWAEAEPEIIEILRDAVRRPSHYTATALNTYAMYLAAEMRCRDAHSCFLGLCRLSENESEALLGDILTNDMPRFLAATWQDDLVPIEKTIEDKSVFDYGRSAALGALTCLVLQERLERGKVILYLHHLLTGGLEREPSAVWDGVVCDAADLHPGELVEPIREAYAYGLVDPQMITFQEVLEEAGHGLKVVLEKSRRTTRRHPVGPVEDEITWMQGFNAGAEERRQKIGRNDPCPCGSGMKFKKCCLSRQGEDQSIWFP